MILVFGRFPGVRDRYVSLLKLIIGYLRCRRIFVDRAVPTLRVFGYLDHEKRTSGLEIKAEDFNECPEGAKMKIIIILSDRLRNLEAENKRSDDAIENRDRTITSFNNQTAALERKRTELRDVGGTSSTYHVTRSI
jgi:hypothetical protein